MNEVKQIPNNREAERAVLGAILIDPDAIVRVGAILEAKNFHLERNQWIFEAALTVHNNPKIDLDYVSLSDELARQGKLKEIGGAAYLTQLIDECPMAMSAVSYARMVAEKSRLRYLIALGARMTELAYNEEPSEEIERKAVDALLSREQERGTHKWTDAIGLVHKLQVDIENGVQVPGIDPVLPSLRGIVNFGVLPRKSMTIIGAAPGLGKTMLGLTIAVANALSGRRMAYVGTEMDLLSLGLRLTAIAANIAPHLEDESAPDAFRLYHDNISSPKLISGGLGAEVQEVLDAIEDLRASNQLVIVDEAEDVDDIIMRLSADEARYGPFDGVILDYLQMVDINDDSIRGETNRDNAVGKKLRAYVKRSGCAMVIVSALRKLQHGKLVPDQEDLRGSRLISYDAGLILFLYNNPALSYDSKEWAHTVCHISKNSKFGKSSSNRQGEEFPVYVNEDTAILMELVLETRGN